MSDEVKSGPPAGGEGDKPAADEAASTERPVEAGTSAGESAVDGEAADQKPAPQEAVSQDAAALAAEKAAAAKAKAEALAAKKAAKAVAEAAKPPWLRDPAVPEWRESDDDPVVRSLAAAHGDAIESARSFAGDLTLVVRTDAIRDICVALKDEQQFTYLVDICGVDFPEREPRFEVVYHLFNMAENRRIRLKVGVADGAEVPTVTTVWKAANWPEREVYDMYGVRFTDHPDMTRILLWEGFNGHPLRKDFPVEGIDTGAAIYPEYYDEAAGPVAGTGTGWRPPAPEEPEESAEGDERD